MATVPRERYVHYAHEPASSEYATQARAVAVIMAYLNALKTVTHLMIFQGDNDVYHDKRDAQPNRSNGCG